MGGGTDGRAYDPPSATRGPMLHYAELVTLERALRGRATLSVYLDGGVTSPVARTAWRRRLEHALGEIRSSIADCNGETRHAFESANRMLLELLAPFTGALGSASWVAFVTSEAVELAAPLAVPLTGCVAWDSGPRVVPMLRPLKLNRGAVLCVADPRATRIFRYRRGRLERLAVLRGVERADSDREIADAVDRMLDLSLRDDWLLFGGPPAHAIALAAAVPPRLQRRAVVMPPLSPTAGEFEIAQASERAVAGLRRAYETAIVDALLLRAGPGGCSVSSADRTAWALRESSVEELVLTRRFAEQHPVLVESLVRDAFDQGAMVEEVGGSAAERLDAAGGVGALLRSGYRTPVASLPMMDARR